MLTSRLVISLALGFAASGVRAQTDAECRSPDASQQTMTACAYQAFEAQDRELNALYKRVLKQSDGDSAKQLQAAQRAWLQFRDLECIFESPDAPGSLGPQETAECKAALTKERIADLKRSLR